VVDDYARGPEVVLVEESLEKVVIGQVGGDVVSELVEADELDVVPEASEDAADIAVPLRLDGGGEDDDDTVGPGQPELAVGLSVGHPPRHEADELTRGPAALKGKEDEGDECVWVETEALDAEVVQERDGGGTTSLDGLLEEEPHVVLGPRLLLDRL